MGELYQKGFTQNRELSWLRFNDRVLDEAADESVPLLERLKFLAIFTSNLAEFFMIRVGSLFDLLGLKKRTIDSKSGMTPKEQLARIFSAVRPLYLKREKLFYDIERLLREQGVCHLEFWELEKREKTLVRQYFEASVAPILSPQIIDTQHPFPHLANQALYIGVLLRHKNHDIFGVLPVPDALPDVFFLPGGDTRYLRMETILLEYAERVFQPYEVLEKVVFCVTRNADVHPDDEVFADEADLRKRMKKALGRRSRLAPVRLELSGAVSEHFSKYFCDRLQLSASQIYVTRAPLKMAYTYGLAAKLPAAKKKAMLYPAHTPAWPASLKSDESIARQVEKHDVLLSYPYESMEPFLRLLRQAATDPAVLSIKITIYRLASKARLVEYLCAAAENGKSVTVLMELRARFDEQNNIDWSERLEEAGCTILYGFELYKVHSKVCLITRKNRNGVQYITQVGTGNYNENTAKLYTDLSLITADPAIGRDAAEFFKNLAIGNLQGEYQHLLVAPAGLKPALLRLIDEEILKGAAGRIFIKINSLTDAEFIDKLSQASCAGVQVELIVRGICCLLPGLPGKTENIRVTSIVGRFLEHARIYCFGEGRDEKMFLSSADFMTRNTERRVEVACPIHDEKIRRKIHGIIEAQRADTCKARLLLPDGTYTTLDASAPLFDSQQFLLDEAAQGHDAGLPPAAPAPAGLGGALQRLWARIRRR